MNELKEELIETDEVYYAEAAMSFLMEVVCGLHSKIKGETEIYGQYKKFLEDNAASDVHFLKNKSLQNYVFNKIKILREQHLYNLGSQSYGSLLRKKLAAGAEVSILGSGLLSLEILPWLKKNTVSVFARDVQKDAIKFEFYHNVKVLSYQDIEHLSSSVVIAASMSDEEVLKILNQQNIKEVFDFRAGPKSLTLPSHIKITYLEDIFLAIEEEQKGIQGKVAIVKDKIYNLVQDYANKSNIRPLGWDDLCA